MSASHRLFAFALLFLLPGGAQACWLDWLFGRPATSYYTPAPAPSYGRSMPVYPSYPAAIAAPRIAPAPTFAVPTAAPPSSGPIAPRPAPEPGIAPRDPVPAAPSPFRSPEPPVPPIRANPPPAPTLPQMENKRPPVTAPPNAGTPPPIIPPAPPPAAGPGPAGTPEPGSTPSVVAPPQLDTPTGKKAGVLETRSYYDAYPVVARAAEANAGKRFAVGFWNLSDRDAEVKVEGQARLIPRGQKWTVELPREFRWEITGRGQNRETVPENEAGLEIVLRR